MDWNKHKEILKDEKRTTERRKKEGREGEVKDRHRDTQRKE